MVLSVGRFPRYGEMVYLAGKLFSLLGIAITQQALQSARFSRVGRLRRSALACCGAAYPPRLVTPTPRGV